MAKTVIRNDRRAKSNTNTDSHIYTISDADSHTYSDTHRHTYSDNNTECNSKSYANCDLHADTVTNLKPNIYTKAYTDPETPTRATSSPDTTALICR